MKEGKAREPLEKKLRMNSERAANNLDMPIPSLPVSADSRARISGLAARGIKWEPEDAKKAPIRREDLRSIFKRKRPKPRPVRKGRRKVRNPKEREAKGRFLTFSRSS